MYEKIAKYNESIKQLYVGTPYYKKYMNLTAIKSHYNLVDTDNHTITGSNSKNYHLTFDCYKKNKQNNIKKPPSRSSATCPIQVTYSCMCYVPLFLSR